MNEAQYMVAVEFERQKGLHPDVVIDDDSWLRYRSWCSRQETGTRATRSSPRSATRTGSRSIALRTRDGTPTRRRTSERSAAPPMLSGSTWPEVHGDVAGTTTTARAASWSTRPT